MSIKSFGNPNARYKATMSRTGDLRLGFMSCNPNQTGSWYGDTAVYGGGYLTGNIQEMDFFNLDFTSNAGDFGDMTVVRDQVGADFPGNATSVAIAGGNTPGGYISTIDYVVVGTTGNASDFGNLTGAKAFCSAASGC